MAQRVGRTARRRWVVDAAGCERRRRGGRATAARSRRMAPRDGRRERRMAHGRRARSERVEPVDGARWRMRRSGRGCERYREAAVGRRRRDASCVVVAPRAAFCRPAQRAWGGTARRGRAHRRRRLLRRYCLVAEQQRWHRGGAAAAVARVAAAAAGVIPRGRRRVRPRRRVGLPS